VGHQRCGQHCRPLEGFGVGWARCSRSGRRYPGGSLLRETLVRREPHFEALSECVCSGRDQSADIATANPHGIAGQVVRDDLQFPVGDLCSRPGEAESPRRAKPLGGSDPRATTRRRTLGVLRRRQGICGRTTSATGDAE